MDGVHGRPDPGRGTALPAVHSLIDQSLHSRLGATTTNGDGFGIGWYGERPEPAVFKSVHPAWNDAIYARSPDQGHRCCSHMSARRPGHRCSAATATVPWAVAVDAQRLSGQLPRPQTGPDDGGDPSLYADIEGSTDSETSSSLAPTFGLTDDPVTGVERAVGFVEDVARRRGVEHPVR